MTYYLVVEKLNSISGIYGTEHSQEKIKKKLEENEDKLGFIDWVFVIIGSVLLGWNLGIYYMFSNKHTKIRLLIPKIAIRNILPLDKNEVDKNFKNYITIPALFLEYHSDYKNKIFQGYIKSESELEMLLPINSYNEIIIISENEAKEHFSNENEIKLGLNFHDKTTNILHPLKEFSWSKWKFIQSNLIHCFRNLGAKEIYCRDFYQSKINVGAESGKADTKIQSNFTSLSDISFNRKISNTIYNKEIADQYSKFVKDDLPITFETIQDMILHEPTGDKLEYEEIVKMNFGIDLSVLEYFQGKFEYSYEKNLKISVTF